MGGKDKHTVLGSNLKQATSLPAAFKEMPPLIAEFETATVATAN